MAQEPGDRPRVWDAISEGTLIGAALVGWLFLLATLVWSLRASEPESLDDYLDKQVELRVKEYNLTLKQALAKEDLLRQKE